MTWPHQVGVLPRQADSFQDRGTAQQLKHAVDSGGTAVLSQVMAGMGGVGKTQLAAHHARTLWQTGQLDLLVWVTAASRDAIVAGYAQAAVEVLGADPTTPEVAAREFLAWLEPKPGTTCRWLVVLDDLADPVDLRGLWPPASPHGRTLVTTRRRDAAVTGHGRRLVRVGLFTESEATAYLTTALAAHDRHEPADQLVGLAHDLGLLPLALSQAATYLIDVGLDCATYRHQLTDRGRALTNLLPDPSGLPDDQPTAVAATWSLSLDRADQLSPMGLARPMLQLVAVLDPNGIPMPILASPPALAYISQHRTVAAVREATAQDATGALRALHRLSLVDHVSDTPHPMVRVHQLVQRAARDALARQERSKTAWAAADALVAAWPDTERDTALAQALRANAEALRRQDEESLYQADEAHLVLFRSGRSLGEAGQVTAAVRHFEQLASVAHICLGPDHPETLIARNQVAMWRGEAGDVAGAVTAYEELLADRQRVLGPEHPDTLVTRHNLADWRGETGDAAGAVTALEELLPEMGRVLGPEHPETQTVRHTLASWRSEAGDDAGAVTAYEELLADRQRVLGPEHPDTLATRHNLADCQGRAGDAAGAVTALEELLAGWERVLGPEHPRTLNTRLNLAYYRGRAGDAAGAVTALEELLADRQRVLGPEHPDT
ncbi:tetratricopeptide repeat protein, partial [Streptomyces sp. NRRL WC-3605]|uniref:tetratricopeptide repeat protein n=3 Tax=unclassified Streptomyces TaxID=2593676 RepID=UPI0007C7C0FA